MGIVACIYGNSCKKEYDCQKYFLHIKSVMYELSINQVISRGLIGIGSLEVKGESDTAAARTESQVRLIVR